MGAPAITAGTHLDRSGTADGAKVSFALLFAAGARPSVEAVERLLGESASVGTGICISHRPAGDAGWLELLASGLTFDLAGLAPSTAAPAVPARHWFGLPEEISAFPLEAIVLTPGEHIASAAAALPVVRVMAGLAALLAAMDGVKAVAWSPAGSWIEPAYFRRVTANWLAGGPFPALGLTALRRLGDGVMESDGLGFFIGQELRIEGGPDEDVSATVKCAVRAILAMVQSGRLHGRADVPILEGETWLAESEPGGGMVRIWRET